MPGSAWSTQSLACYRLPCPLWWSWCTRLTGLVHPHPFLYVYHPYSLSGSPVRPFHFALPLHLANACCSFVFKPFGRADLKDLHKFLGSQPKRSKKKKKIQVQRFSPSKTIKIFPGPACLCHFTASSKCLQPSHVPAPETAVQPCNY